MNINEMIVRLTEVRDQNAAQWPERNSLPMVIALEPKARKKGQHYRPSRYFPVAYASSAMHGLPVASPNFADRNALVIAVRAGSEIIPDLGFPK